MEEVLCGSHMYEFCTLEIYNLLCGYSAHTLFGIT